MDLSNRKLLRKHSRQAGNTKYNAFLDILANSTNLQVVKFLLLFCTQRLRVMLVHWWNSIRLSYLRHPPSPQANKAHASSGLALNVGSVGCSRLFALAAKQQCTSPLVPWDAQACWFSLRKHQCSSPHARACAYAHASTLSRVNQPAGCYLHVATSPSPSC